ncbi:MAG: polysaccharide deacetylase family protein [Cyclobacteriaceae bacterium]|nr:polysaccharide deacetylase family protein [Cyclobacteriaceae bacterium]
MFFRNPFFLPWIYPQLTWRIPTTSKELYLTFDDGPVPGPTQYVLETLLKSGIKSTFFCIGDNVRKHPEVFNQIIKDGHAIGNHTFNHLSGWKTSAQSYIENVNLCEEQIQQQAKTRLFRPPYGRITRTQIKALSDYQIVMWDVLTHDYNKNISPENCLKGSIGATREGSIIVFHDSLKAEKNMTYVLPRFIDHFMSQGYSFKTLH